MRIMPFGQFIVLIICVISIHSIFATSGYCENCEEEKEDVSIYTNKAGMIRTIKTVDSDSIREVTETVVDSKGKLIHSKYTKYKEDSKSSESLRRMPYYMIQVINNGIVWDIIQGETPCDFVVVGPYGDSVSFHLDPNGERKALTRNEFNFFMSMVSSEYEYVKDTLYGYEDIVSSKQKRCWRYHLPWPKEEK